MATKPKAASKAKTAKSKPAAKPATAKKAAAKKPAARTRSAAKSTAATRTASAKKPKPAAKRPAAKAKAPLRTTGRAGGRGKSAAAAATSGRGGRGGAMLSRSTLRAKWIDDPEDHPDRQGQSLATRSHDVIRRWAERRGAKPATVEGSWYEDRPGVLRFDFPGYSSGRLQEVDWDQWFRTFDERKLVFLFQEQKRDGSDSNFFRFDSPDRENT
jgi:hypothetical protein